MHCLGKNGILYIGKRTCRNPNEAGDIEPLHSNESSLPVDEVSQPPGTAALSHLVVVAAPLQSLEINLELPQ